MTSTILIIGAGQAGSQAVSTLRSEGYKGRILLVGDEPYFPYQRPPLSKKYLAAEIGNDRLLIRPETYYQQQNVEVRLSVSATRIDRAKKTVTFSDHSEERYDKLLIATGARVRKLTLPHADLQDVLYLRTIADVDLIQPFIKPGKKVVLVGGGYIGLEVAAVAVKRGATVTVVEMAERLMARTTSEPVASFFEAEHRKAGVQLRLGAMCQGFEERAGRLVRVRLADGSAVEADVAIVGVGVEPAISLAKDAGVVCENGIRVDEFGRTSDPDIYAAGDCTNHPNPFVGGMIRLESVQNAIDQAKHAALAMIGKPTPYNEVPWFWSDQYDLKLQSAGIAREYDQLVTRGDPESRNFAVFYLKDHRMLAVDAVNAVPEYMFGRKLIAGRKTVTAERLENKSISMKEIASD